MSSPILPFYKPEQKALSQFTLYSADGLAALHAERYAGGKTFLETSGIMTLDKEQLKGLMVWLGMDLEDE